jgi:hypothetical protein
VTLEIVIGILIILVVLVWVVQPLRRAQLNRVQLATAPETQRLENLLFEREVALLAIRDLQLDHEMGKMSDSDFAELDIRYRAHAIEILKELDALGVATTESESPTDASLDAWIERAVAEARQGKRRLGAEGAAEA